MATVMRMPGVSADANEAALVEWSVEPGSALAAGDVIAVVETEKANVDIAVDEDARLWRTLVEPGNAVAVGSPIAVLLGDGEDDAAGEAALASVGMGSAAVTPAPAAPAPTPAAAAAPAAEAASAAGSASASPAPAPTPVASSAPAVQRAPGERIAASPLVRKLAKEAGVSLEGIVGTGPRGRIIRADLERALAEGTAASRVEVDAAPQSAPSAPIEESTRVRPVTGSVEQIPHSRLRRAIANALTSSKRNAPHFYLKSTVRVDALMALRAQINASGDVRVSINDLVVKAVARAFRLVPELNVIWTDDAVHRFDSVDIAVAIGSERGLVTPVLRDVDRTSVSEVSTRVRDFAERANAGRLKQDELEGGVFTISNLGMFGVEEFSAIINPPHVGILAVGAVVSGAVVEAGTLTVGHTMTVTASFDHRPVDGVLGARWLSALTETLENPFSILV